MWLEEPLQARLEPQPQHLASVRHVLLAQERTEQVVQVAVDHSELIELREPGLQ